MLAGTFLVAGLATLSLPGLAPFISEFLVLIGTFTRYPVFAVLAATCTGALRDLHPVDVPADDDRPGRPDGNDNGCATCGPARSPSSHR